MTTQTNTAAAVQSPSLIMQLHGRWSACQQEYNKIDCAQGVEPASPSRDPESERQWRHYHRCDDGMSASHAEAMHLRMAILYQVPIDKADLTIVTYHLWSELGDLDPTMKLTKELADAVTEAMNSVFDYMISESFIAMDRYGKSLEKAGLLAFYRRRYRTGLVDDDD